MGNMKKVLIKAAAVPAAATFVLVGAGAASAVPAFDIDTSKLPETAFELNGAADVKADVVGHAQAAAHARVEAAQARVDGIVEGAQAHAAAQVEAAHETAAGAVAHAQGHVDGALEGVGGIHFGGAAGGGFKGGLLIDLQAGLFIKGLLGLAIHGGHHGHGNHHEPAPCKPVEVIHKAQAKETTVVYTSTSNALPQTGVPAAALAGAGVATIVAGAGITYLARRREA